jgi:dTMP kinase
MGKLIVIEGTDSSGKQTQAEKLYERLKEEGKMVMKVSFPNYESPSSAPIKMYLSGEFGEKPGDVNPYASSVMYAVDRYASFKTVWGEFYKSGGIVIADRYTSSNMIHQASKIDDDTEKAAYLDWLEDLEFEKLGIPKPDLVMFLNMPTEVASRLMSQRKNKFTGQDKKDIHEEDNDYMKKSHRNACTVASRYGWEEISCVENGELRSIDDIAQEIYARLSKLV